MLDAARIPRAAGLAICFWGVEIRKGTSREEAGLVEATMIYYRRYFSRAPVRDRLTFNQVVASSTLARLINENKPLRRFGVRAFFLGSPRDHLGNQF